MRQIPSNKLYSLKTAAKLKKLKIIMICVLVIGPFNYHMKIRCECLYQFLINLMLSISIQQIFKILKRHMRHTIIYVTQLWEKFFLKRTLIKHACS